MSPVRLRLGPKAVADIDLTVEWLSRRSVSGAEAWLRVLDDAKAAIVLAPSSYPLSHEARRLRRDLREALFKTMHGNTYRIIFVLDGDEVIVLRVRGSGQKGLRQSDL